jgi:hypothetical protein
MLIVKIIIAVLLGLVVLSLGAGMFSLIKDGGDSNRTLKFLTIRIALSIVTFLFIALAFYMGWIQPHGVVPPAS